MMKKKLLMLFTALLLVSSGIPATERPTTSVLKPFKANYKVFRKGSELGEAYRQLLKIGDQYVFETDSKISWLFLADNRHERSTFKVTDDGVFTPLSYDYKRTGTGRDRITKIEFGPTAITTSYKSKDYSFDPKPGILDPQLYQLVMQQQLISGKTEFEYQLIRRGKLISYNFKTVANEEINLPYGKIATIRLERIRKKSRRKTIIWVAPSLNYTMVKMTQYKDGKEQADLQLSWLKFEGEKPVLKNSSLVSVAN